MPDMLRAVQEDGPEEEAPGSILDLCGSLLACTESVKSAVHGDVVEDLAKVEEKLEFSHLWAEQALIALRQGKVKFGRLNGTVQKLDALSGAVHTLQQAILELLNQVKRSGKSRAASAPASSVFCSCFSGPRTTPMNGGGFVGQRKFDTAHENLEHAVDLIRAVDTSGEGRFVFADWLPGLTPISDPFYKRPVAFDTVTSYLLAEKLPGRILIHGPSGNGKTSLLRQIQGALKDEEHPLHQELTKRFPEGLKWVDCGYPVRTTSPNFGHEIKQRALSLAQDLLPHEDERLAQMDLPNLAAVIKQQLTHGPFIAVFDNVWDGGIFRRDCLNILPDQRPGTSPKGIVLVTSQFNLSSICQWHSPETITIPLSAESNISACVSLLASLWSDNPAQEDLPEHLQASGRKLVRECNGSPLAIKLIAPLLEGSPKERKWRDVLADLNNLIVSSTFRRDSSVESGSGSSLPRVLYAFQLRARALPRGMRQLLSIFGLFAPAQQIPVAAALHIFSQICDRSFDEARVLLRGLSNACYVEIRAPYGQFLAGTVAYHGLLKQFLVSAPEYREVQLPGTATEATMLSLALTVLYAAPSYQQQALQVFSKLRQEDDSTLWEQPLKNRRNPFLEPFWLQLLSVLGDSDLGPAARVPVVGAARRLVSLAEVTRALALLFSEPRTLLAAAGVFSELAWQIQDRSFLHVIADELEAVRALSRLIMRLRELTAHEGSMAQAEELAVLAWAFADLAEHISDVSRLKLRSEPVIPLLQTCYQGAAIYAYQRLLDILEL